jgi:hypothetical protein
MENVNWFLPYGWEKLPKGELAMLILEGMTALTEQEQIVERAESEVARLDQELAKAKINLSDARYFLKTLRREAIDELQARYKEL